MARKQKTIHYLYKTTCNVTGRYYIGMHSTCNVDDGYMGSGKRLRYSLRKYGFDNHIREILEYFESRELLIEAEKKAITPDMITDNNCMNLKGGGTGGFTDTNHRKNFFDSIEKSRETYRDRLKNDNEFKEAQLKVAFENFKKRHVVGKNNYDTFTGKQHSNETKKQISETKQGTGLGEDNSQYGTCWITKDGLNKKIKKEELETYLIEGWVNSRILK